MDETERDQEEEESRCRGRQAESGQGWRDGLDVGRWINFPRTLALTVNPRTEALDRSARGSLSFLEENACCFLLLVKF